MLIDVAPPIRRHADRGVSGHEADPGRDREGTIYTLLSKPVTRTQFLLQFGGLATVITMWRSWARPSTWSSPQRRSLRR